MRINGIVTERGLACLIAAIYGFDPDDYEALQVAFEQIADIKLLVLDSDRILEVTPCAAANAPTSLYHLEGELEEAELGETWTTLDPGDWSPLQDDDLSDLLLQPISSPPSSRLPSGSG